MPRKYKRKEGVQARVCSWTTEQQQSAFDEMNKKTLGINEISRQFGISSRTLRRRYAAKNTNKLTLGKHPILDFEHEKRLVKHILKLGDAGFPPNRQAIRMLAYQFAEKLGLKHNFDHENEMVGSTWFKSFIEQNPELSIRQAEGLSVARAKGLNREEVNNLKTKQNNEHCFSENEDVDQADLCDKENDKENYLKVNHGQASLKRIIIFSSNSEDEDNPPSHKIKGKKTKGLPVKNSKRDRQDNPRDANKDTCIECIENYKNTKCKSDWFQCVMCQNWLHETCTLFRNYCSKCGKLIAISG